MIICIWWKNLTRKRNILFLPPHKRKDPFRYVFICTLVYYNILCTCTCTYMYSMCVHIHVHVCNWIWEKPIFCKFHQNWDFTVFSIELSLLSMSFIVSELYCFISSVSYIALYRQWAILLYNVSELRILLFTVSELYCFYI